jgi:autotransporter translocation and assembly factor TamB
MAKEVVALNDNKDITVLQPLGSEAYRKTQPTSQVPYELHLNLGKKAKVTRNDFSIPISGRPTLKIVDTLITEGNIRLEPGGRLQLAGKTFIIERGQVALNPDEADNPRFEVEAHWRGPTHTVIATVAGTRKEAELHLTSDPPLGSESQVLSLLLSGNNSEMGSTTAGLGVGASLFNEFMSETPLSAVELRTSQDEQHANYTAAVPLKENLWFEGTYQNANNSGLRPNSSTSREGFSGTVDYRFRKNWSLRTEVGTLGAGADILWQYRY